MIPQTRTATNPLHRPALAVAVLCLLVAISCGKDGNGVDPGKRLCGGEAGLGVSIGGRAQPLEFCTDDGDVSVLLTALNRYDVAARIDTPAGAFQVRMLLALRVDSPVSLLPVQTISEAMADAGTVWIYYEEVPDGGDAIESLEVTGGSFRLTYSDENVLAGVFEGITFTMHDVSTGAVVGSREFTDGFFSLSVKSPAAAVAR